MPAIPMAVGPFQSVFFGGRVIQTSPRLRCLRHPSVNYSIPTLRKLRPYVKFDVYNLFDNEKLIAYSTTVSQNKAAGVDNLGLATSYTPASSFGTGTGNTVTNVNLNNNNTYPLAFNGAGVAGSGTAVGGRTLRMSVGFRF